MKSIPDGQGNIELNEDQINSVISQLMACAQEMNKLSNSLDEICTEMKNIFKGECADTYIRSIENIETNVLTPTQKLLASYPKTLHEAIETVFENDSALAKAVYAKYSSLY